jgi:alkylation response protein AidB-like acyl-CoA dehydrogenase
VWVRFGPGRDEVGAVAVDRDAPGLSVDASHTFLSGEPYGMLFLDECTVPAANVLVDHDGLRAMLPVFNIERLGNAARSLAAGQAAFDLALAHIGERRQFGKLLSEFQGLRWRLAETGLQLESARLLLYRAAVSAGNGLPAAADTAMAKLACNRAGFAAADAAVQLLGGLGFDAESVAGYLFHRTRGWMIAGGTVEQMLNRIASGLISGAAVPGRETLTAQGAGR